MPYKNKLKRPDRGLCRDCPRLVKKGFKQCERCLKTRREPARERMERVRGERIKEGRCQSCGGFMHEDADGGRKNCFNCRENQWSI